MGAVSVTRQSTTVDKQRIASTRCLLTLFLSFDERKAPRLQSSFVPVSKAVLGHDGFISVRHFKYSKVQTNSNFRYEVLYRDICCLGAFSVAFLSTEVKVICDHVAAV
jgi:hypothetical protein